MEQSTRAAGAVTTAEDTRATAPCLCGRWGCCPSKSEQINLEKEIRSVVTRGGGGGGEPEGAEARSLEINRS